MSAGLLHPPTSFATLQGAIAAMRCWIDAAKANGKNPAGLCATLSTNEVSTSVMLGTRAYLAAAGRTTAGKVEAHIVRAILEHSPEETFLLVDANDGPPCGAGISKIDGLLTIARGRDAAH